MIGHSIVLRALAGKLRDVSVANGMKAGTHLSEHPGSEHSPVHPHACTGRMQCCVTVHPHGDPALIRLDLGEGA